MRELLRHPAGLFGTVVVGLLPAAALLSLFWTPYPLLRQDVAERWLGPDARHWLGTDEIGRDTLSWLLAGSRTTVFVAFWATLIAAGLGLALAALTALGPRRVAEPVIVLVDLLIAFPVLLIAMLLAAAFGGSLWIVVTAVGVGVGMNLARVLRPEIRRVIAADYVVAARAGGVGPGGILARHVVPNVAPVAIVQLSYVAAVAILAEAGLSYLGYGAPAGSPSWGRSLADSQHYIAVQPASVLWPGLAIAVTVLAITLLGDALRDALDPRLRRGRRARES
ncbi:ABC transporter permease [Dactylosporangium vinaceum]|uniref:ABC transporter permease n=1 Tax=Dactylosporangium vinaceum TaxID=53362 RepID=A0ABV5M308_9ACTN|nr:ABC transporter permease [Dactylosporangium vinaceum]UAB99809.1 ABC transporter permease [Dactylosporangium vinaceum]